MTKILIIDDEPLLRDCIGDLLEQCGYLVTTARDAATGLRRIQERGCEILVTDVIMPGMSGIDLIREVRRLRLPMRIVAMTGGGAGRAIGDILAEARRAGAEAALAKPFGAADLLEAVSPGSGLIPPPSRRPSAPPSCAPAPEPMP
jgi:two-component system OmpR family response regulator